MAARCVLPLSLICQGVCGLLSESRLLRQPQRASSAALSLANSNTICNVRSFSSRGGRKGELLGEELFVPKTPKVLKALKSPRKKREKKSAALNGGSPPASDASATEMNPSRACSGGGIHLIIGPMFAGKSTTLLRRVQEEADCGRSVALVKSDKDTRYDLSAIVTHDGQQMPCYAVSDLATFRSRVGEKAYKELDVIGVDEAQFFTDLYEFCLSAADFEGKTLIVAGLDGDFLRRRFGSTLDLIPIADSVVKLSSKCEICGQPASFSFRKTLDINAELVGGADIYMPVCRQHFVNGQAAVETASRVIDAHTTSRVIKD